MPKWRKTSPVPGTPDMVVPLELSALLGLSIIYSTLTGYDFAIFLLQLLSRPDMQSPSASVYPPRRLCSNDPYSKQ